MGSRYRTGYTEKKGPTMAERAAVSGIQPNSISIQIELNQKKYWGFLNPSVQQLQPGIPVSFELYFWGEFQGTITYALDGWACSKSIDQVVLNAVGNYLLAWYE